MTRLPLDGIRIRVADFGWILAVPHATAWLAVMGAEVIKIESMQRPDLVRLLGQLPGKPVDIDGGCDCHPEQERVGQHRSGARDSWEEAECSCRRGRAMPSEW